MVAEGLQGPRVKLLENMEKGRKRGRKSCTGKAWQAMPGSTDSTGPTEPDKPGTPGTSDSAYGFSSGKFMQCCNLLEGGGLSKGTDALKSSASRPRHFFS